MKDETATNAVNTKIKCELCGKYFKSITNSHLRDKHNTTTYDYKNNFPEAKMISEGHNKKLAVWRNSERNRKHLMQIGEEVWTSEKRINAVIAAVKRDEYRKNHSKIMKDLVKSNPELFPMVNSPRYGKDHHHYGKSNWHRWAEKYGKEIADEKLMDWKNKNKLFSKSKFTSGEIKIHEILNKHSINFISQYSGFDKYYVDIFIPEMNLVLEVDGDFWHANPKKYSETDILNFPSGPKAAKEVWEKDRIRQEVIESYGVIVRRIFQSEISEENVLSLIRC
jgi:G:T-mismatch repair DNA endonuclease (very short patch repair protein)